jgi:hypothetical protein
MTHGCSPFAVTRRNLTPLDIVTAHSVLPGREDVALLLEEAMRGEGWTGGKMEERRRLLEQRRRRHEKQRAVRDTVARTLGVNSRWWGDQSDDLSESDDESGDEEVDEDLYVRGYQRVSVERITHVRKRPLPQIIPRCSCSPRHPCLRFSNPSSLTFSRRSETHNQPTHYICSRDLPA